MKSLLYVAIAMLLVTAFVAACGGGDDPATRAPEATVQQVTPSEDSQAMTDEDGQTMTDEGGQAMTDEDSQAMTDEDGQATTDEDSQATTDESHALSPQCVPGGALYDAAIIAACSAEAVQGIESFAFDAEFDLAAVFPVDLAMGDGMDGAGMDPFGQSAMTFSGAVVLPDTLMYSISLGLGDEVLEINAITVGADNYIQEPESGVWLHGEAPLGELMAVTSQPGLLLHPQEDGAILAEVTDLDGVQVYVLTYEPADLADPSMPGQAVTRFVGVDDYLPREVRIRLVGLGDEDRDIVTIRYHSYDDVDEIEPPANAIAMPAMPEESMEAGGEGSPTVVGFASDESGDIQVIFSEPVYVEGTIGLFVIDPATGGWEIPFIGGSGTDTLTFDAGAEGSPPLVSGENQIGGITFPDPDSDIADADGNWPIWDFGPWTYE